MQLCDTDCHLRPTLALSQSRFSLDAQSLEFFMAWYGNTYGRPQRRLRVEECSHELCADTIGRWLNERGFRDTVWLHVSILSDEGLTVALPADSASHADSTARTSVQLAPRRVPCQPNARRWVFRCPACSSDRRRLYTRRPGDAIRCRVCHRLTYQSAQAWDNWARRGHPGGLLGSLITELEDGGDGSRALARAGRRLVKKCADAEVRRSP